MWARGARLVEGDAAAGLLPLTCRSSAASSSASAVLRVDALSAGDGGSATAPSGEGGSGDGSCGDGGSGEGSEGGRGEGSEDCRAEAKSGEGESGDGGSGDEGAEARAVPRYGERGALGGRSVGSARTPVSVRCSSARRLTWK